MTTIENTKVLKDLGLSDIEIQVYIHLLKNGGSTATSLAQIVGIKRTTIYPILERLMSQNIVTEYKQGKASFFKPIRPQKLVEQYEQKLKTLISTVPFLEQLASTEAKGYGIQLIRSKKELERFYDGILEEYAGQNYYIIGDSSAWLNLDREFFLDFRKKRANKNIQVKLLLSHDSRTEIGQDDPALLRTYKYLPERYVFKSTIDIYKDKIIIVGPEVNALAVVIAVPPMVDIFRVLFETLWESL